MVDKIHPIWTNIPSFKELVESAATLLSRVKSKKVYSVVSENGISMAHEAVIKLECVCPIAIVVPAYCACENLVPITAVHDPLSAGWKLVEKVRQVFEWKVFGGRVNE